MTAARFGHTGGFARLCPLGLEILPSLGYERTRRQRHKSDNGQPDPGRFGDMPAEQAKRADEDRPEPDRTKGLPGLSLPLRFQAQCAHPKLTWNHAKPMPTLDLDQPTEPVFTGELAESVYFARIL